MADRDASMTRLYFIGGICALFAILYGVLDLRPDPLMALVLRAGPPLAVASWLARDAKRQHLAAVQDAGWLFYLGLPLAVPWYSWRTRGGWWLAVQLAAAGLLGFGWGAFLRRLVQLLMHGAA